MSLVHEAALFSGDFSQREVVRLPGNAVRICHVARQLAEAVHMRLQCTHSGYSKPLTSYLP